MATKKIDLASFQDREGLFKVFKALDELGYDGQSDGQLDFEKVSFNIDGINEEGTFEDLNTLNHLIKTKLQNENGTIRAEWFMEAQRHVNALRATQAQQMESKIGESEIGSEGELEHPLGSAIFVPQLVQNYCWNEFKTNADWSDENYK